MKTQSSLGKKQISVYTQLFCTQVQIKWLLGICVLPQNFMQNQLNNTFGWFSDHNLLDQVAFYQ